MQPDLQQVWKGDIIEYSKTFYVKKQGDLLRFGSDALHHIWDVFQVVDQAEDVQTRTGQISRMVYAHL